MLADYFRISLRNLRKRKIRSFLTILGIVIGIVSVVGLISIGQGMQQAINEEFKTVGQDRIIIKPGGEGFTGSTPVTAEFSTEKLYEHDLEVIQNSKGVYKAIGVIIDTGDTEFDNTIKYNNIFGVPTDSYSTSFIKTIDFFIIEDGREFEPGDKYKAIVGYRTAKELFDKEIRTGNKVIIKGHEFKVIGVQKKTGSPVHDSMIRIPLDVSRELLVKENKEFTTIFAKVQTGLNPLDVAETIKKEMRNDHDVKEGEEDFTVTSSIQLMEGFNNILNIVQIVLIGIAGISLLVGGVGIMNTMYTSVLQRRKEIGIMKSIGAKNSDILMIFLIESGILGIIGGIIGVILGISLSKGIEIIAFSLGVELLKAYISAPLIIGALIFSFLIGAVSGLMPARQAAKLQPVDALRGF